MWFHLLPTYNVATEDDALADLPKDAYALRSSIES